MIQHEIWDFTIHNQSNGATHIEHQKKNQIVTVSVENHATIFWDRKETIIVNFLPRVDTINSAAYDETPKKTVRQYKTSGKEC